MTSTGSEVFAENTGNLRGKTAIITGAGRGIGAATALRLARDGAQVVINDISSESADHVAREVEAMGRTSLVYVRDISDYREAHALVDEVIAKLGRVDVLVNNAGITRDAMLQNLLEENWDEVIRVNLKGPFNIGQACVRHMIERKQGRIVNIASTSRLGNIGQTNYSAAKAGLVGMTRTWALELARHGINVNAVAPGFIDTSMTRQIPTEIKSKITHRIPLRRMGRVEEIAATVAFLVGEGGAYITGQCIQIDGGLSVGLSGI